MYSNSNQEWAEEIASTHSSTSPTLSQPDKVYRNSNCGWEKENISTRSSEATILCDMYWSNNSTTLMGPAAIRVGRVMEDQWRRMSSSRSSIETRILGRFPMRNCFIAEYIFRTTGKRRSAKQVGSRLQQIRDSCRDEKLLRLLSPMPQRTHAGALASKDSFPFSLNQASPNISSVRHTAVRINILPKGATEAESNHLVMEAEVSVRPPCRISSINPTVAFSSSSLIEAESRSAIYVAGRIVHIETTPLTLVASGRSPGFIYSTTLVPKYWEVISKSSDPTQFTVYQEIFKSVDATLIFSGTYTFEYPAGNSSSSPSSVDTPNSDSDHLVPAAPTKQFREERYPLYIPPEWRPTLRSPRYSPAASLHS
ncbi:TEA domain-containing protein [Mycena sanguinolenta]|uniref:TEA domain-containing protein n=1 Tax=Mycena sanguinolenta TaxID=230812 RepID=A0A8H6Z9B6_9AGAR|nr:TEA domain-containing protein [Mycena sanguinolenta]